MRILPILAVALLPLAGFLGFSEDSQAPNRNPGLSMEFTEINDEHPSALAVMAGATYRRRGVYWHEWRTRGMARYEPLFTHLDTMGFKIIVVFYGTPRPWQERIPGLCPGNGACPPADRYLDEWNAFVSEVSDSFPYIDHYEVWNEPFNDNDTTHEAFFFGSMSQLVELTERAINSVNPEDVIIGPGNIGSGRRVARTVEYLDSLKARGIMVDKISGHAYTDGRGANDRARFLRDTLARLGYDKPIWMTELGWYDHTPTNRQQKEFIDSVYGLVRDSAWYEVANYWMWTEQPAGARYGEDQRGIVELRGTVTRGIELESYCALVDLAGNAALERRCN